MTHVDDAVHRHGGLCLPDGSGPPNESATSLPAIVHAQARQNPGRTVFTALDRHGDPVASLTVGELDILARSLAAELLGVAAPGDRVLLPPLPGLSFHVAFLACLYARLVAVPIPPIPTAARLPNSDGGRVKRLSRLLGLCRDARPAAVVVPGDLAGGLAAAWAGEPDLDRLRILSAEPRPDTAPIAARDLDDPDEVAFLQYTSGSTSVPRGVMITHRAMLANQAAVHERTSTSSAATMVSWLPLYHDMGLCLGLLMPIYAGSAAVLLEPETFLVRPERWLQAISGVPEARSAAPDFAYAWCARRVGERAKAGLDLSGWKVSVSGAEPVRADTLRAFFAAFAGCGLSSRTVTPSYGLAEATLFVTGASVADEPVIHRYDREALNRGLAVPAEEDGGDGAGLAEVVGCGRPGSGIRVAVVDPETRRPCPERTVGEIWVDSPSNGAGYWGRPDESWETFGAQLSGAPCDSAQRWLRTGDLGFMDGNELFVTGRRKDLILVHGVNYYPHDFERLAQEAHPLLGEGLAAAFVLGDANRVTVVVEAGRPRHAADSTGGSDGGDGSDDDAAAAAAAAAVRAVTAELPVMTDVVVVSGGQLPRTTSGKIRRHASAEALRDGQLSVLAEWPRTHVED